MVSKEIKLCGKNVYVAYCYATEIAFYNNTETLIDDFMKKVQEKVLEPNKVAYLIIAAITAYYQAKGEEPPVTDKEILFESEASDIFTAFGKIVQLYTQWRTLPADEEKTQKKGKKSKNA